MASEQAPGRGWVPVRGMGSEQAPTAEAALIQVAVAARGWVVEVQAPVLGSAGSPAVEAETVLCQVVGLALSGVGTVAPRHRKEPGSLRRHPRRNPPTAAHTLQ